MKCIVTAGPTYEPLDEVRRLTNFSTGRLGSEFVNYLAGRGHEVTLLIGQQATWRGERKATVVETFTTTDDLRERLQRLSGPEVGAVFHAAAVNDFKFGNVWQGVPGNAMKPLRAGKIPTRAENLLVELVATAKVIAELRSFYPKAVIVGWKFEVDGDQPSVIEKAKRQISDNKTDACVANGAAYGPGFGIVTGQGKLSHCETTKELFEGLEQLLRKK